jgi:hypothetical protein
MAAIVLLTSALPAALARPNTPPDVSIEPPPVPNEEEGRERPPFPWEQTPAIPELPSWTDPVTEDPIVMEKSADKGISIDDPKATTSDDSGTATTDPDSPPSNPDDNKCTAPTVPAPGGGCMFVDCFDSVAHNFVPCEEDGKDDSEYDLQQPAAASTSTNEDCPVGYILSDNGCVEFILREDKDAGPAYTGSPDKPIESEGLGPLGWFISTGQALYGWTVKPLIVEGLGSIVESVVDSVVDFLTNREPTDNSPGISPPDGGYPASQGGQKDAGP